MFFAIVLVNFLLVVNLNLISGSFKPFVPDASGQNPGITQTVADPAPTPVVSAPSALPMRTGMTTGEQLQRLGQLAATVSTINSPNYNPANLENDLLAVQNRPLAISSLEQAAVNLANSLRKKHGARDLFWNPQLAIDARQYAQTLLKTDPMVRQDSPNFGQNLYKAMSSNAASMKDQELIEKALNAWYSESSTYRFDQSQQVVQPGTENFSQLIWSSTTEFGMGIARGDKNAIVVGNFVPKGNKPNQFSYNVFRIQRT